MPKISTALPEDEVDPHLAANFMALLGSRSVGGLRAEMAERGIAIGSAAIHAAKYGSRGLRLETLQKFADFFGYQVFELLKPDGVVESAWPFTRLLPGQVAAASEEIRLEAEEMIIRSAKRASARK